MFKQFKRNLDIYRAIPEIRPNIRRSYYAYVVSKVFVCVSILIALPIGILMILGELCSRLLTLYREYVFHPVMEYLRDISESSIEEAHCEVTPHEIKFRTFGELNALPTSDRRENSIDELLAQSKARVEAMSPNERKAMYEAQRESWIRGEMAMGSDKDEEEYRSTM